MSNVQPKSMPNLKKVTLDNPIKRGDDGEEIKEIGLRKPSAGELRGLSMADLARLDVNAVLKLLPRISVPTLTQAEVNLMQTEDLFACCTEIGGFLLTKADMQGFPAA